MTQDELARPLTDSDKLRVLAAWFDMWDARDDVRRRSLLDDQNFPGKNDVQRDLRRIADALRATPVADTAEIDAEAILFAALYAETPPEQHGQLCPVWTRRKRAKPGRCDCWVEDKAHRRAAALAAALRTPKPEGEPE